MNETLNETMKFNNCFQRTFSMQDPKRDGGDLEAFKEIDDSIPP